MGVLWPFLQSCSQECPKQHQHLYLSLTPEVLKLWVMSRKWVTIWILVGWSARATQKLQNWPTLLTIMPQNAFWHCILGHGLKAAWHSGEQPSPNGRQSRSQQQNWTTALHKRTRKQNLKTCIQNELSMTPYSLVRLKNGEYWSSLLSQVSRRFNSVLVTRLLNASSLSCCKKKKGKVKYCFTWLGWSSTIDRTNHSQISTELTVQYSAHPMKYNSS